MAYGTRLCVKILAYVAQYFLFHAEYGPIPAKHGPSFAPMILFVQRVSLFCRHDEQWRQSFGVLGIPQGGLVHVLAYCRDACEIARQSQRTHAIHDHTQIAIREGSRSSLRQAVVLPNHVAPVAEQLLYESEEQQVSASHRRPRCV